VGAEYRHPHSQLAQIRELRRRVKPDNVPDLFGLGDDTCVSGTGVGSSIWLRQRQPGETEYPVTLCDLGIFADQATEPVPSQDPDIRVRKGRMLTPRGWALAERPVRAMNVIVVDVLT
jgi:hypothetical protein